MQPTPRPWRGSSSWGPPPRRSDNGLRLDPKRWSAFWSATRALGGELEVETTAGEGTTIRMIFSSEAMSPDMVDGEGVLTRAAG